MKIVAFELTPSGGSITVKSDKRYKKGGWGRNPMETAPLHDLCRLLQSAGLKVRKLRNYDPKQEPYSLGIGGRGPITAIEIQHGNFAIFSAGECLNKGQAVRFEIAPGWANRGTLDWLDTIPVADYEDLFIALENTLSAAQSAEGVE